MSWKKVCPSCGYQNTPMAGVCAGCDYELNNVAPVDISDQPAEKKEVQAAPTPAVQEKRKELRAYKLCPACGHHNPPLVSICENTACGYELYDVVPTMQKDEPAQAPAEAPAEKPAPAPVEKPAPAPVEKATPAAVPIRRCPGCGHCNPFTSVQCAVCHRDITMVIPQMKKDEVWIVKVKGGREELVIRDGQEFFVGSAACLSMDIRGHSFVSGEHVLLACRQDKLYVSHRSRTNPTLLNGQLLSKGYATSYELQNGDEIALGQFPGQPVDERMAFLTISKK